MARPTNIWAVSDGRAGIERQALALADAIANEIPNAIIRTIRLNPQAPQVWLPPQFWPAPIAALPLDQAKIFDEAMPDIWVGNGRRAIAYSMLVKKQFPKTFVVQIQDPKVPPEKFDMVVSPLHDTIKGENVRYTLGGLVYYSDAKIIDAKLRYPALQNAQKPKTIVILGGNSKTHKFTNDAAIELIKKLKILAKDGATLWITASRRTPENICDMFRELCQEIGASFFESETKDGANPYLSWLTNADAAIITEDSANMIADAAFFKLPIHLVKLQGSSNKFDKLHQSFINIGAAKWFDGNLNIWTYSPVNSVAEIAKEIVAKTPKTHK